MGVQDPGVQSTTKARLTNAALSVATWFVDPQNSSGLASDANDGTTNVTPLLTYAELVNRWGGTDPSFPASLVTLSITFMSAHTDDSDPVVFNATSKGALVPQIKANAGTVVVAGALAGVTAKNRTAGANSSLIATLPAGAAVGQMVVNTTRGNSRAWVKKSLGAGSFELSQPFSPQTIPTGQVAPTEVDTWANTDAIQCITPIAVNLVSLSFLSNVLDGPADNNLYLYNLTGFDPNGAGNSFGFFGIGLAVVECTLQRFLNTAPQIANGNAFSNFYSNTAFAGGGVFFGGNTTLLGGCSIGPFGLSFLEGEGAIDGDFAFEAAGSGFRGGTWFLGLVWMGASLNVDGNAYVSFSTQFYASHVVYGRAAVTLNLKSASYVVMASGTWAAGWTAPTLVTGVTANGGTTAQTHTNASPDVVTSGVTTSVANLDAASGGNMRVWNGVSLSKAA